MKHTLTFGEKNMEIKIDKSKTLIDKILSTDDPVGEIFNADIIDGSTNSLLYKFDSNTLGNIAYSLRAISRKCSDTMCSASDSLMIKSRTTMDEIDNIRLDIQGEASPRDAHVDMPTLFAIMNATIYGMVMACEEAKSFKESLEAADDTCRAANTDSWQEIYNEEKQSKEPPKKKKATSKKSKPKSKVKKS